MNASPDLSSLLETARRDLAAPGILCAVNRGGRISTHSAGTLSAADHDRPFYIYSITKTFTAAAILLLAERNGCFLDQAVVGLLPGAPVPAAVTVRQLLNHTGGLSDYSGSAAYQDAVRARPEAPWPYEELMRVGLERTPLFPPGEGWAYSNPGYALLNEIVARLSGVGPFEFFAEAILRPLGLRDTRPFLEADAVGALLPADEPSIAGDFRRRYAPGWILPGCLISTAADVARFFEALFAGRLLGADSLAQMKTTVDVPVPAEDGGGVPAYGLGVMHARNHPLGEAYGHGGGGPGYTTYARCHPAADGESVSFCLVINRGLAATPIWLGDRIVRLLRA